MMRSGRARITQRLAGVVVSSSVPPARAHHPPLLQCQPGFADMIAELCRDSVARPQQNDGSGRHNGASATVRPAF